MSVAEFVGGPWDGFRVVMPEPLPPTHRVLQAPNLRTMTEPLSPDAPLEPVEHLYRRTDSVGSDGQRFYQYEGEQ